MSLEVVILAAGEGRRMRSRLPKALHTLAGYPIVEHVLKAAKELRPARIHLVIQPQHHPLFACRAELQGVQIVHQEKQLGTAHAVNQAMPFIAEDASLLVLCGDAPLIQPTTLQSCVELSGNAIVLVSAIVDDPKGLGRILRNEDGSVAGIVEDRDTNEEQYAIKEINSGVICGPRRLFADHLSQIDALNDQQEFYLTDLIGLARESNVKIECVVAEDPNEALGINDRLQLADIERKLQKRKAEQLLLQGVGVADPARIDIRGTLQTSSDCFLDVNVILEGDVVLGEGVSIGPGCLIKDCVIGDGVEVKAHSVLENARVGQRCEIGPFARIRPDSVLEEDVKIGNFVEIKSSHVGQGSKAGHLAYVGDAELGERVNVGAGAITCNYDGKAKHKTIIGDDVFVGTNCTLVAPIVVHDRAFLAAGSTITKNVQTHALAVGRSRQRTIKDWNLPSRRRSK